MSRPPKYLYRAQHDLSAIVENRDGSFKAGQHYPQEYLVQNFERLLNHHLNWAIKLSPFISLFDNITDAKRRREYFLEEGQTGAHIRVIEPGTTRREFLQVHQRGGGEVSLPVWTSETGCRFFSATDANQHLNVSYYQSSEWFAIDFIPEENVRLNIEPEATQQWFPLEDTPPPEQGVS